MNDVRESSRAGEPTSLCAVVLTQNVAGDVPRCLQSLSFADEIMVVDACSTDGTPEAARTHGARVITNAWPGFAAQREFALKQANAEWVFMCDSDEVVTDSLARAIRAAVSPEVAVTPGSPAPVAYRVKRRNFYLEREMRHGPWAVDWQLRLFRRSAARVTAASVHEGIEVNGPVGTLDGALEHHTHRTLRDSIARINRYTTLEAADRASRRRIGALDPVLAPPGVFLNYLIRGATWRDGMPGLMLAATTAFYKCLLYIKIRVLQRREQ